MSGWELPRTAVLGAQEYALHADYRDVLDIILHLQDENEPDDTRLFVAMSLFYDRFSSMPQEQWAEAAACMMRFLNGGEDEEPQTRPAPKRIDWQQDKALIVADVNRVAGFEVRAVPFLHWWTFLSYFSAIGEGQLSTVVSIREKRRRGQKLEAWERDFYAENKAKVDFKRRYTAEEKKEQERLLALLQGEKAE